MDNVNNVVDLLDVYTCGMIVLLAMNILNIQSPDDDPATSPNWETDDIKSDYIMDTARQVVRKCQPLIDHRSILNVAECGDLYTIAADDDDICICDGETRT